MQTGNRIITIIAAVFLIAASALKAYQLLIEPIVAPVFWESWEFYLIMIPLEMGLGIWLLCGLFRKAAWLVAIVAYVAFMGTTLYRGLIGADSCGCFGPIEVNPWITFFTINITILGGLLIFRPKGEKLLPPPWPKAAHFFGVAIPTFIFLPSLVFVLIFNKPPDIGQKYVVVRPDKWDVKTGPLEEPEANQQGGEIPRQVLTDQNQPAGDTNSVSQKPSRQTALQTDEQLWPMLDYIDIADSIRSGLVVVVLSRHDCPDCHEAIPEYDKFSRDMADDSSSLKFAFIEVPPFGSANETAVPEDTVCLTGRLDSTMEWLNITAPLVAVLMDGVLLEFWHGEAPEAEEILNIVFGG